MTSTHDPSLKRPLSPAAMEEGNERPSKKQALDEDVLGVTMPSSSDGVTQAVRVNEEIAKDVLDGLEAELQCGCCVALAWRPILLNPCHHVFCGSCLVQWVKNGGVACPACRAPPTSLYPARVLHALSELLLRYRPQVQRSQVERDQADEMWVPGELIELPPSRPRARSLPPVPVNLARPCPHCSPHNALGWTCPQPIPDPNVVPRGEAWDLDTQGIPPGHGFCAGCDELHALTSPSTSRCSFCSNVYCGYSIPANCVAPRVYNAQMPRAVDTAGKLLESDDFYAAFSHNSYEADELIDYLRSRPGGLAKVLREIVDHIRSQPRGFAAVEFLAENREEGSVDSEELNQPNRDRDMDDDSDEREDPSPPSEVQGGVATGPNRIEILAHPVAALGAASGDHPASGSQDASLNSDAVDDLVLQLGHEVAPTLDHIQAVAAPPFVVHARVPESWGSTVAIAQDQAPEEDVNFPVAHTYSSLSQAPPLSQMDVDLTLPAAIVAPTEDGQRIIDQDLGSASGSGSASVQAVDVVPVSVVVASAPRRRAGPSRLCRECAEGVFFWGIYDWWGRERAALGETNLPQGLRGRKDCENGRACGTQHDSAHARQFNHICEPKAPSMTTFQNASDQPFQQEDSGAASTSGNLLLPQLPAEQSFDDIPPLIPPETPSSQATVENMITVVQSPPVLDGIHVHVAWESNFRDERDGFGNLDVPMDEGDDDDEVAERQLESAFSAMEERPVVMQFSVQQAV